METVLKGKLIKMSAFVLTGILFVLVLSFLSKTSLEQTSELSATSIKLQKDGSVFFITTENVPFKNSRSSGTNNNLLLYKTRVDSSDVKKITEIVAIKTLKEIYWSGNNVLIKVDKDYENNEYPITNAKYEEQTYLISLLSGEEKRIPNFVSNPAWIDEDRSVYFNTFDPGIKISTDNRFKEKPVTISDSKENNLIEWVNKNTLITSNSLDEYDPNNLFISLLNIETKETKKITTSGNSAGAYLSPNKKHFAFIELDPTKIVPTLFLGNLENKKATNLNLKTFVSKTAWSEDGKYLYVASPENFVSNDEEGANIQKDNIWRVNTKTGKKKIIYNPRDNKELDKFFITSVEVSKNGKKLYLTDDSSKIYTLSLPLISF